MIDIFGRGITYLRVSVTEERIMAYTAAVITISDKGYRASGRTPAAPAENILAVIDPVAHGLDMLYSEGSADCAK